MASLPPSLERLIGLLSRLPGIGRKSATRIALRLLDSSEAESRELARSIVEACEKTIRCSTCGGFTEEDPCGICTDVRRDQNVVCVVERSSDIIAVERTGRYRGRYHVLGGLLSPLDGVGPENLRIDTLVARTRAGELSEIILALNPTAEGEATSGDLDLADVLTLGTALEERREL